MLIDRARVKVTAGAGGDGCCSFRREKYVPHGGPDGGDGGKGGDVYFVADDRLQSLLDLRYHAHWKGKRGVHGMGKGMHGKQGEDTEIRVPPGTIVRDFESQETLIDLVEPGARYLAARGGQGGKGNARFANAENRVPRFCEKGEPGEEREYLLELKLIAEVGLVGLPNAGKSTFLAQVSAATPKIADYPFTTLSPNLGVAPLSDHRSLTIADIPGIIEGAAEGKGLGHEFLRHIERNKVLLFLIDAGDPDPLETLRVLQNELAEYSEELVGRPRVIAFNKADVTENRARFEELASKLDEPAYLISGATGEGVGALLEVLWQMVDQLRHEEAGIGLGAQAPAEYRYEAPYTIEHTGAGYRVEGAPVLRALRMTDFENEEAVRHLQSKLEKMGLFKALKRMGAEEGDPVFIDSYELEYHE